MIDDARDKMRAGQESALTDEQRMVLTMTDGSLQMDSYWAKKYYNANCYYQSLEYFRRIEEVSARRGRAFRRAPARRTMTYATTSASYTWNWVCTRRRTTFST